MHSLLSCLLLPHASADGPTNMARDEVLLEHVTSDPSSAAFRTYAWSSPTLSLGYFQAIAEAEQDPRWRQVPLVRRPTGGGAIWHDREITYALAIPAFHPLSRNSSELYQAVHAAIANLFIDFGLHVHRRGDYLATPPPASRPFLCFTDRDSEDIVHNAVKLVGSAQRRRAGAILQHGSILLSRSLMTPELPGAADFAPSLGDPQRWSSLLRTHIPDALGFSSQPIDWSEPMLARADFLAQSNYRNPAWTRKR